MITGDVNYTRGIKLTMFCWPRSLLIGMSSQRGYLVLICTKSLYGQAVALLDLQLFYFCLFIKENNSRNRSTNTPFKKTCIYPKLFLYKITFKYYLCHCTCLFLYCWGSYILSFSFFNLFGGSNKIYLFSEKYRTHIIILKICPECQKLFNFLLLSHVYLYFFPRRIVRGHVLKISEEQESNCSDKILEWGKIKECPVPEFYGNPPMVWTIHCCYYSFTSKIFKLCLRDTYKSYRTTTML